MKNIRFYLVLFLIQTSFNLLFAQSNDEVEKRIASYLSKLTLEEKIGQTCQITLDAILATDPSGKILEPLKIDENKLNEAIQTFKVGSILNVSSHTIKMEEWKMVLQQVHKTYLGGKSLIPILYGVDAIHGVNYTVGGTLFPQEIGLAASWNPTLAERFGEITAYELRASGIPWNFSPVLDLGRQPLWSRFFETLGEDPYLASTLGSKIITGYQGNTLSSNKFRTLSCMKHFVGYSMPLSGRDRTPAWIPEIYMQELFLPSFKKAVENGAMSVMINSGEVNGIPGHLNRHLITDVLKKEWGFQGFAVTDWEDIIMLETVHQTARNQVEAISKAFEAGIDMSMVPNNPMYKEYCKNMKIAIENGSLSMDRLNDAVSRILRTKIMLGLFENPTFPQSDYPDFASKKHQNAALEAALESITLLENKDNTLPLKKGSKVLITGATSNNLIYLNGAWTHTWQGIDTTYNTKNCKTIKQAISEKNGKNNTEFSQGVSIFYSNNWEDSKFLDTNDFKTKAKNCDYIVLCVGELPGTEKYADIRSLNLDSKQMELAKIAYASNKPVILVLNEGRPRIIRDIVPQASAIVQTYLPGDYGADALASILFGEVSPSGKLPYSYPKYDGVKEFYDHKKSEKRSGKSEKFDAYDPQWDFGHGLSYSTFSYSNLKLSKSSINQNDSIEVCVTVTNSGKVEAKEVIQLYISRLNSNISPFGKQLKKFEKINLKPNEAKEIKFNISAKDIIFVNESNKWINESGQYLIEINGLVSKFDFIK
ncbi:MAG: beta-glucosidase [Flavobacteriia bacterium]|jgi:beta-glucosidase